MWEQSVSSSGRFDQEGGGHRMDGLQSASAQGHEKTTYQLSYIRYTLIFKTIYTLPSETPRAQLWNLFAAVVNAETTPCLTTQSMLLS